jgi:hypothetical protein
MVWREKIAVGSDIHTKHTHTYNVWQDVEFLMLNRVVHKVTNGLYNQTLSKFGSVS